MVLPSFLTYHLFRTFNPAMQELSKAMPHSDFLAWLSSTTLKIFISGGSSWILMLWKANLVYSLSRRRPQNWRAERSPCNVMVAPCNWGGADVIQASFWLIKGPSGYLSLVGKLPTGQTAPGQPGGGGEALLLGTVLEHHFYPSIAIFSCFIFLQLLYRGHSGINLIE